MENQESLNNKIFQFGTIVDDYNVPMVNEREVRAGAGIMFVLAFIAFMNSFLIGNYLWIKMVVIGFFVEFFIRVLINPKFAPALIVGRIVTVKQTPDFSGAPQKKIAWAFGLALATLMMVLIVFMDIRGPINFAVCLLCLTLLFSESAFGICIGCSFYNLFTKEKAENCPAGVCEVPVKHKITEITSSHLVILILSIIGVIGVYFPLEHSYKTSTEARLQENIDDSKRCEVPSFAKVLGHEEKWKLHNGC